MKDSSKRSWRNRTRTMALCAVGAALVGCGVGPDPDGLPGGTIRRSFPAPFEYVDWWDEISACSGESGDLNDVRFFVVVQPLLLLGNAFPCGNGLICNGLWEAPHDITLAPGYIDNETLVKHEMLHDLVRTKGHPPVFEECGVEWSGTAALHPR